MNSKSYEQYFGFKIKNEDNRYAHRGGRYISSSVSRTKVRILLRFPLQYIQILLNISQTMLIEVCITCVLNVSFSSTVMFILTNQAQPKNYKLWDPNEKIGIFYNPLY